MLKLELRTIENLIFDAEIKSVSFSSNEGYLTIYEGHEDMVFQVQAGEVEIETEDGNSVFFVLDGMAKVENGESITMLVNELETTDSLDSEMIKEAIARAESHLKNAVEGEDTSSYEYEVLKARLIKELSKSNRL